MRKSPLCTAVFALCTVSAIAATPQIVPFAATDPTVVPIIYLTKAPATAAAPAPPAAESWLVESGIYNSINEECGSTASVPDAHILSTIILAGTMDPFFRGLRRSDEAVLESMRHPSAAERKTADEQLALYKRMVTAIHRRHASNPKFCSPAATEKIALFANRAVLAGVAADADRIVGLMIKNHCTKLGCS